MVSDTGAPGHFGGHLSGSFREFNPTNVFVSGCKSSLNAERTVSAIFAAAPAAVVRSLASWETGNSSPGVTRSRT